MQDTSSIGIYQNTGSKFSNILTSALCSCGHRISKCHNDGAISVYTAECASMLPDYLDVCVLESGHKKSESFPQAHTVIVPDICSVSTITQLNPKSVITYGLSCKNTVTVSSLVDTRLIISIQREIVTASGKRTGEQEFAVELSNVNQIEAVLASTALLLFMDTSVDSIRTHSLCAH